MEQCKIKGRVHIYGLVIPHGIISELLTLLDSEIMEEVRAVHPLVALGNVLRKSIAVYKRLIKGIGKAVAPDLIAVIAFLFKYKIVGNHHYLQDYDNGKYHAAYF